MSCLHFSESFTQKIKYIFLLLANCQNYDWRSTVNWDRANMWPVCWWNVVYIRRCAFSNKIAGGRRRGRPASHGYFYHRCGSIAHGPLTRRLADPTGHTASKQVPQQQYRVPQPSRRATAPREHGTVLGIVRGTLPGFSSTMFLTSTRSPSFSRWRCYSARGFPPQQCKNHTDMREYDRPANMNGISYLM